MCVSVPMCVCACMCVCVRVSMSVYVCMCVWGHVCMCAFILVYNRVKGCCWCSKTACWPWLTQMIAACSTLSQSVASVSGALDETTTGKLTSQFFYLFFCCILGIIGYFMPLFSYSKYDISPVEMHTKNTHKHKNQASHMHVSVCKYTTHKTL